MYSQINCQALYTFNSLAGDASVGLASINLSIRTWVRSLTWIIRLQQVHVAEWQFGLKTGISLASLCSWFSGIGLWSCKVQHKNACVWIELTISTIATQLKAVWVQGVGCTITSTNNTILSTIFIYSMCFDLIVLLLNTYKLVGLNWDKDTRRLLGHSRLTHMIFADGLIFFIIA